MSTEVKKDEKLMGTNLYKVMKSVIEESIPIKWNQYELSTITLAAMYSLAHYTDGQGNLTLPEIYRLVSTEEVCTASTVHTRISKVRTKFVNHPISKMFLHIMNIHQGRISIEGFIDMLMYLLSSKKDSIIKEAAQMSE